MAQIIGAILGDSNPGALLVQASSAAQNAAAAVTATNLPKSSRFGDLPVAGSAVYAQTGLPIRLGQAAGGLQTVIGDPAQLQAALTNFNGRTQVGTYSFNMAIDFGSRQMNWSHTDIEIPSLGISYNGASLTPANVNFTFPGGCPACGPAQQAAFFAEKSSPVVTGKYITVSGRLLTANGDSAGAVLSELSIRTGSTSGPPEAQALNVINRQ